MASPGPARATGRKPKRKRMSLADLYATLHVHHIDGKKANNRTDNLEVMTRAAHARETNAPARRRSDAPHRGKQVRGKRIGDPDWTVYESMSEAARLTGCDHRSISKCASGKLGETRGYQFVLAEQPDLAGETWRAVPQDYFRGNVAGWQVSNMGRVRTTRGVTTEGSATAAGYRCVGIRGRSYRVHRLVVAAFQRPNVEAWLSGKLDAHHADAKRANNRNDNLEVMTRVAHVRETNAQPGRRPSGPSRSKQVRAQRVGDPDWTTYESVSEAARLTGSSLGSVARCARGGQASTNGFRFELAEQPDLAGETWRAVPQAYFRHNVAGARVSNMGRVRTTFGVTTKGSATAAGYRSAKIHNHSYLVHRLVAAAFLQDEIGAPHPDASASSATGPAAKAARGATSTAASSTRG